MPPFSLDKEFFERVGMALLEVIVVSIIGLFPLLAAPFLDPTDPTFGIASAKRNFLLLIASGQLYLYCFSFVGTLVWLSSAKLSKSHVFFRGSLLVISLLIGLISMAVYIRDPTLSHQIAEYLVNLSIICYATCLFVYFFLLMCASAIPEQPDKLFNSEANNLIKKIGGVASDE